MCEFIPLPPSPSLAFFFCACFCQFQCYLAQTMRKNLRICFEARKIIKNNPFAFFSQSLSLYPLLPLLFGINLVMAAIVGLSAHIVLAKLVDCFRCRFKQLSGILCVYVIFVIYVLQLFRPPWQFVCIIIYYAKSCVKIAVASFFLLCPDLFNPTRSVNKSCTLACVS